MADQLDVNQIAMGLRTSIGLLVRRLRQARDTSGLTIPEIAALARLDRGGPATPSELARQEQITPQSMGATLADLEEQGFVQRQVDAGDRRRVVISLTEEGSRSLWTVRDARVQMIARALAEGFSDEELRQLQAVVPLLERVAEQL